MDEGRSDISFGELIGQFDEKMKKELDNRMVSYYNFKQKCFVYVGNYWIEKPHHTHRDISDAKLSVANLVEMVNEETKTIELKFRERAKGEHSDALMTG